MIEATKIMTFDAGHRLVGHQGKCKGLHGHTYRVEVTIGAEVMNPLGMVLDFTDLKEIMKECIDQKYDHKFIFNKSDPILGRVMSIDFDGKDSVCVVDFNPTAENMALDIFRTLSGELPSERGVIVTKVRLWETPTGYAEVTSGGVKNYMINTNAMQGEVMENANGENNTLTDEDGKEISQ